MCESNVVQIWTDISSTRVFRTKCNQLCSPIELTFSSTLKINHGINSDYLPTLFNYWFIGKHTRDQNLHPTSKTLRDKRNACRVWFLQQWLLHLLRNVSSVRWHICWHLLTAIPVTVMTAESSFVSKLFEFEQRSGRVDGCVSYKDWALSFCFNSAAAAWHRNMKI